LTGGEVQALGPAQTDPEGEVASLGRIVHAARVIGDVEAGNADAARHASDFHHLVEHGRGAFHRRLGAMATGFEADAIHRAIDLRFAQDFRDPLRKAAPCFKSIVRNQSSAPEPSVLQ